MADIIVVRLGVQPHCRCCARGPPQMCLCNRRIARFVQDKKRAAKPVQKHLELRLRWCGPDSGLCVNTLTTRSPYHSSRDPSVLMLRV